MPEFSWNPDNIKFVTAEGELEDDIVRALVDDYLDDLEGVLGRITRDLIDGEITLKQWQEAMARRIKDAYSQLGAMGKGGRNNLTRSDWGRIGGRVRYQLNRLDKFAGEIAAGELSPAQIKFRAEMYARAPGTSYWDSVTAAAEESKYTEMRRYLRPAEHCVDCIDYAARGWQPIGSLPMPKTESRCMTNCKCVVKFR